MIFYFLFIFFLFLKIERNLFSVSLKNITGEKRSSYKKLEETKKKEEEKREEKKVEIIETYQTKIGKEIKEICDEAIEIIEKSIITKQESGENKIFFQKIKADCFRVKAEVSNHYERKLYGEESQKIYEKAIKWSEDELSNTHPLRLSLCLNYSVLCFDILNRPDLACAVSKNAFDKAISSRNYFFLFFLFFFVLFFI